MMHLYRILAVALLGMMCAASVHAGTYATITIDGDMSDWPAGAAVFDDPQGDVDAGRLDIKRVWMANDESYVYLRVDAWEAAAAWLSTAGNLTAFVDVDGDLATGFNPFGLGVVGSEMLLAYDVYSETDGGYNEGALGAILGHEALMNSATSWELAIPRSYVYPAGASSPLAGQPIFGNDGTTLTLLLASDTSGSVDYVPASSGAGLQYVLAASPAPVSVFAQIALDGNGDDWPAESLVWEDAQGDVDAGRADFRRLWMANDADNLYVRIDTWNAAALVASAAGNLNAFIDTDADAATGFVPFGLTSMIGSELLVAYDIYSEADGGYNDGVVGAILGRDPLLTAQTTFEFAIPRAYTHPAGLSSSLAGQAILGDDGALIQFLFATDTSGSVDYMPETSGKALQYQMAAGSGGVPSTFAQITLDGQFDDWPTEALVYQDAQGDVDTGRTDIKRVWMANDANNVYLRVDLWNSVIPWGSSAGSLVGFFDVDQDALTGFVPFGLYNWLGSEMLMAFDLYSEADGYYNDHSSIANIGSSMGAVLGRDALLSAGTSFELAIPRSTLFPEGLDSPLAGQFVFGGDGDEFNFLLATDTGSSVDYSPETAAPAPLKYALAGDPDPPTFLEYKVPLIDPLDAPDVTDASFDSIYSDGGQHPVIGGGDWKDWSERQTAPFTAIGEPYASGSQAYLLCDGTYLYFGMKVYDPDTSAMTSDVSDDSGAKWSVESIELAFSSQAHAAGAADAAKFAFDAFGHIDDMIPDGTTSANTTAKTYSNSYVIDAHTWAVEMRVGLDELVGNTALASPLPAAPGDWYGHIGYQSPTSGDTPRVPLYAAGYANGFADFYIHWDLSGLLPNAASHWAMFE